MYPPLPSGVGSLDLADFIMDYKRPVVWCYKPINWWLNSMAKNNPVTHNIVHQQSFINKSINENDFKSIDNKEYYLNINVHGGVKTIVGQIKIM